MEYTIEGIKDSNKKAGYHWFDPAALEFFNSKIDCRVWQGEGGVFFITSEQFEPSRLFGPVCGERGDTMFTVRQFDPETGNVTTYGEFNIMTEKEAVEAAITASKGYKSK